MKRKMSKKVLCLCMVAVLAIGLAIPTFAASWESKSHIHSGSQHLNLEGSGYAYTNRDVTVYSYTSSLDQVWSIENRGNGRKVYTAQQSAPGDNNTYALNINNSNYNCNIYQDVSSNNTDSEVYISGAPSQFTIDLAHHRGSELAIYGRSVEWGGVSYAYWTKD